MSKDTDDGQKLFGNIAYDVTLAKKKANCSLKCTYASMRDKKAVSKA